MPLDLSDFEVAMVAAWFIALLATCAGIVTVFEIKQRRSPVGRLTRHRRLGV